MYVAHMVNVTPARNDGEAWNSRKAADKITVSVKPMTASMDRASKDP